MPARRRTVRQFAAAACGALLLSSCGNTDSWVAAHPAPGWAAQYADAANSSYVDVSGANALRLDWTRSVKGSLGAQVALGSTGATNYLAANAQTAGGCSLMVWEADNKGRQRWCSRLWQGGGLSGPLFDGFDNLYVGQPGAMLSFPPTQWIRWRLPVIGVLLMFVVLVWFIARCVLGLQALQHLLVHMLLIKPPDQPKAGYDQT